MIVSDRVSEAITAAVVGSRRVTVSTVGIDHRHTMTSLCTQCIADRVVLIYTNCVVHVGCSRQVTLQLHISYSVYTGVCSCRRIVHCLYINYYCISGTGSTITVCHLIGKGVKTVVICSWNVNKRTVSKNCCRAMGGLSYSAIGACIMIDVRIGRQP